MKLTFNFPAYVSLFDSGAEVSPRADLNGRLLSQERLESYLDQEVADEGVTGGVLRLVINGEAAFVQVVFWVPDNIAAQVVDRLRADVIAQLDDGIGEGGFSIDLGEEQLLVTADPDAPAGTELADDGTPIRAASQVAIAARDGNLKALLTALRDDPTDVDRRHQGYSALHLATLYGHIEVIRTLLEAGADPNLLDPTGETPLELCALSNSLDDEQSSRVTTMLIQSGADPAHVTASGETAKSYAKARKKLRTAELL